MATNAAPISAHNMAHRGRCHLHNRYPVVVVISPAVSMVVLLPLPLQLDPRLVAMVLEWRLVERMVLEIKWPMVLDLDVAAPNVTNALTMEMGAVTIITTSDRCRWSMGPQKRR